MRSHGAEGGEGRLRDDGVDEAVLHALLRRHEEVAVRVLRHLLHRLPGELAEVAVECQLVVQDLVRLHEVQHVLTGLTRRRAALWRGRSDSPQMHGAAACGVGAVCSS